MSSSPIDWTKWAVEHAVLIEELSERWQLRDLTPAPNLSYSYVLMGYRREHPVVLKLSPDRDMIATEDQALRAFQGHGVVELLEEDITQGALLLERLVPGTTLKTYFPDHDEEAIQVACELMGRLHCVEVPKNHAFPHIQDWLTTLDQPWDVPEYLLAQARTWRDELLATQGRPVLLHGDLHHDNILKHGETWAAIDPKGVIGEKAYEMCAFLRNPLPMILDHPNLKELTARRIEQFSKILSMDPKRLWQWHFVQCILAACWMCEDGTDPAPFLRLAESSGALDQPT